jgi:hypothetical protein
MKRKVVLVVAGVALLATALLTNTFRQSLTLSKCSGSIALYPDPPPPDPLPDPDPKPDPPEPK